MLLALVAHGQAITLLPRARAGRRRSTASRSARRGRRPDAHRLHGRADGCRPPPRPRRRPRRAARRGRAVRPGSPSSPAGGPGTSRRTSRVFVTRTRMRKLPVQRPGAPQAAVDRRERSAALAPADTEAERPAVPERARSRVVERRQVLHAARQHLAVGAARQVPDAHLRDEPVGDPYGPPPAAPARSSRATAPPRPARRTRDRRRPCTVQQATSPALPLLGRPANALEPAAVDELALARHPRPHPERAAPDAARRPGSRSRTPCGARGSRPEMRRGTCPRPRTRSSTTRRTAGRTTSCSCSCPSGTSRARRSARA